MTENNHATSAGKDAGACPVCGLVPNEFETCWTHDPDAGKGLPDELVDEALAEMGRQAREDEACSICHASVRSDRRDRHLAWHVSLAREVERERLPEVYGNSGTSPRRSDR